MDDSRKSTEWKFEGHLLGCCGSDHCVPLKELDAGLKQYPGSCSNDPVQPFGDLLLLRGVAPGPLAAAGQVPGQAATILRTGLALGQTSGGPGLSNTVTAVDTGGPQARAHGPGQGPAGPTKSAACTLASAFRA